MAKFKIETIVDNDAAVAKVTVKVGTKVVAVTGSSKRHPKDRVDKVTGEALAVSRALAKAQEYVAEYADNRIESSARRTMVGNLWGDTILKGLNDQSVVLHGYFDSKTPLFQGA